MIVVLLGASSSGKSTIEKILSEKFGYEKIISYTTRPQRLGETNGKDYYFITNEQFQNSMKQGLFAEYDEYSQDRFYGTLKSDYKKGNKVVVLTPNGLRQLKRNCRDEDIYSIYVDANLGTRVKRYIDRCDVNKFNFDDKNEIASRVERDFAMFLGIEKEVNLVVNNNEGEDILGLTEEIHNKIQDKIKKEIYAYTE
jgi:guanylate kinase